MQSFTLNIGLIPSKKSSRTARITASEVKAALRGAGFFVSGFRMAQSAAEPTAVVRVIARQPMSYHQAFCNVSLALVQECIAVVPDTVRGALIGPDAAEWGEFNPAYFIPFDVEPQAIAA